MQFLKNRTVLSALLVLPIVYLLSLVKTNTSQAYYKVEFDRFWTYKVHNKKKFDMIVLGDSRVYRGISPQVINNVLPGIKIINFGFSSGILDNEIFSEAYSRIDKSSEHKIVLIGISPGSLTDYENNHFHDIKKMTTSEVFDKLYTNYFISKFLAPTKPSEIFNRTEQKKPDALKEQFYDNGWVASTSKEINHSTFIQSYEKYWKDNKVSENKINDLYLRIRKWKEDGVTIFAFRAPASLEIDTLENIHSGFNEDALKENIEKIGGHWISLEDIYNRYSSYDGCHLDAKSATILSKDIAIHIDHILTVIGKNNGY